MALAEAIAIYALILAFQGRRLRPPTIPARRGPESDLGPRLPAPSLSEDLSQPFSRHMDDLMET